MDITLKLALALERAKEHVPHDHEDAAAVNDALQAWTQEEQVIALGYDSIKQFKEIQHNGKLAKLHVEQNTKIITRADAVCQIVSNYLIDVQGKNWQGIAESEGWRMEDVEKTGVLTIQRHDSMGVFANDQGAIAFVRQKARKGSDLHIHALLVHDYFVRAIESGGVGTCRWMPVNHNGILVESLEGMKDGYTIHIQTIPVIGSFEVDIYLPHRTTPVEYTSFKDITEAKRYGEGYASRKGAWRQSAAQVA